MLIAIALQFLVPAFRAVAEPRSVSMGLIFRQMVAVAIPSMVMWLLMYALTSDGRGYSEAWDVMCAGEGACLCKCVDAVSHVHTHSAPPP